jgi:hypothetical protein
MFRVRQFDTAKLIYPENEGTKMFRKVGKYLPVETRNIIRDLAHIEQYRCDDLKSLMCPLQNTGVHKYWPPGCRGG